MTGEGTAGNAGTIAVEPPVHVETFPSHYTVTWKACPLEPFLDLVRELESISPATPGEIDDRSIAGRHRSQLADIAAKETINYLKILPDAPWNASWERRTWPVVSLSGTPPAALCRYVHVGTTGCGGWTARERSELRDVAETYG